MKFEDTLWNSFGGNGSPCEIKLITGKLYTGNILEIKNGFVRISDGHSENIINTAYILEVITAKKMGMPSLLNKPKYKVFLANNKTFTAEITEMGDGFIWFYAGTPFVVNSAYIVRMHIFDKNKIEIPEKESIFEIIRDYFFDK